MMVLLKTSAHSIRIAVLRSELGKQGDRYLRSLFTLARWQ